MGGDFFWRAFFLILFRGEGGRCFLICWLSMRRGGGTVWVYLIEVGKRF